MNNKLLAVAAVLMLAATALFSFVPADAENTTMLAASNENQYTITFNSNGGTSVESQTTIYNYYISLPTNSTRSGYVLTGWNTSISGSGITYQPGSLYPVQGNTTLYAIWTAVDKYYDTSMNTTLATGTGYTYTPDVGSSSIPIGQCIRDGFSYGNTGYRDWRMFYHYDWSMNAFTSELTGTASTWLNYELNKTSGSGKTYIEGLTFSGTPSAPGVYTAEFIGKESGSTVIWYKWLITVTDASSGNYTVSFSNNGGSGSGISSRSAQYNNLITLPGYDSNLPSRTGYTQTGWQDVNGAIWPLGSMYPVSSNVTMKAYWVGNANVVVFDVSGSFASSGSSAYAVYTGSSIKMPDSTDLTKTGHTLLGWFDSTSPNYIYNKNYELASVSGDKTLVAYFVPSGTSTYSVTYNANGGTCSLDVQTQQVESGKYVVTPSMGYNRSNYTMTGWNTKADGSGTSYALGSSVRITANTTLYAQWASTSGGGSTSGTHYTVYFALNGGSGNIGSQSILSGETASKPAINPTKPGSVFAGWSLTKSINDIYDFSTPITGSITLTAMWQTHFTVSISDLTVKITLADSYIDARQHKITWGDGSVQTIGGGSRIITSPEMEPGTFSSVTVETYFNDNTSVESTRSYYIPASSAESQSVTLQFKTAEGGSGFMELTGQKGATVTLPDSGFSREGYVLSGWAANGLEKSHEPGAPYVLTEDTVFFTVWSEEKETMDIPIFAAIGVVLAAAGAFIGITTKNRYALAVMVLGIAIFLAALYAGGYI